jgi:hypothetical protein
MEESFQNTCFGHAFFKTCQYGTIEFFFYENLKHISIKSTKFDFQKCITWPEKFGKGRQEWAKSCIDFEIYPRKLNTLSKQGIFLVIFVESMVKDLAWKFAICFFLVE